MKIVIKCIALALVLALSGCGAMQTKDTPPCDCDTINVGAEHIPEPANVTKPRLPIEDLNSSSTDAETATAYDATVKILLVYAKQLEEALLPFRKASKEQVTNGQAKDQ